MLLPTMNPYDAYGPSSPFDEIYLNRPGTGGAHTAESLQVGIGYLFNLTSAKHTKNKSLTSPSEDIQVIRTAFGLSLSALAALLHVTRQALYDWQQNKWIAPNNKAKLKELTKLVATLKNLGEMPSQENLFRKIQSGKSVLELALEISPSAAANRLMQVLQQDCKQKQAVSHLLARPPKHRIEDLIAPHFEDGDA